MKINRKAAMIDKLFHRSRFAEQREQGFTLIELLVVILIIGILAAIAIPIFLNQRKEAADASLKSDIKTVATYLETYKAKNPDKKYPRMAKDWKPAPDRAVENINWPADLKISEGNAIITSDAGDSQAYFSGANANPGDGFCIEGQAYGGNSSLLNGSVRVWYSSLKGGFTNTCKL